jgi:plastocyanin
MRGSAPVVALAAVLVLAGCGEKRHTSSGSSGGSSTTISETEFKLNPASPSVAPGSTITVKNDGTTTHAFEIELQNGEIRTKPLSAGQSVQVKAPDKAGSYTMYCPIDHHKQMGMTGKLTVGGSSSGGGSSTGSSGGGGGSSAGGY